MSEEILSLRPTQFSLGFIDVDDKIDKIDSLHNLEQDKAVPVVKGPKNQLYIIDHHHFVRAMWEYGRRHVKVKVVADYSSLSPKKFWLKMRQMEYVFLFDQFGNGPHRPELLPKTVRNMADNPYRSLAWMLREAGCFTKSDKPFSEFYWAEYLRANMGNLDPLSKKAFPIAKRLCRSKKAKSLPGYKNK